MEHDKIIHELIKHFTRQRPIQRIPNIPHRINHYPKLVSQHPTGESFTILESPKI
jgi:hypothetical protein